MTGSLSVTRGVVQGADSQIMTLPVEDGTDGLPEIATELRWLREVIRQAPVGICLTIGPEHRIVATNAAYREIIGRDVVPAQSVREALPELEQQGFVDILDEIYRTGEPYEGRERVVLLDRDGDGEPEPAIFNFLYQPLRGASEEPFGIVTHAVEVTEHLLARQAAEQKAAELARLTSELQRSNEELDQFAHVASHDLKAPLRAIASLSRWIEEELDGRLDGTTRDYMELLRDRVHRMESLVDGILQYSRAGRVCAEAEQVDARALLAGVIDMIDPPPTAVIEIDEDMPVLHTQVLPLQQVFLNLIGNALKHAGADALRVRVSVCDNGAFHEFSVADNGRGIAPQHRDRIWGIFQMLEPMDTAAGTGLGLALVKKIVTSRGGAVWVESADGAGADFRFLWPRRG